jgi:diaminopimelate decarboxylase
LLFEAATLQRHYKVFADAFADVPSLVCYAMKANSNQAVIATLARLGAGVDVVSGGELKRALAAGVPPEKIMFSGVGKTMGELAAAVDANILCIKVESEPELDLLSQVAAAKGASVCVSVRGQSRCRRQDPCQDRNRQVGEQVRRSDQPSARGLLACRPS